LNTQNQISHDEISSSNLISSPSTHQRDLFSLSLLFIQQGSIHLLATHMKGFLMRLLSTSPNTLASVHTLPISGLLTYYISFLGRLLVDYNWKQSKILKPLEALGICWGKHYQKGEFFLFRFRLRFWQALYIRGATKENWTDSSFSTSNASNKSTITATSISFEQAFGMQFLRE